MNNPQTQIDSFKNNSWLQNLALEEINMDETGIVRINEHIDPSIILENESIKLMDSIRSKFESFIEQFNQLRSQPGNQVKLFKIANTANDFMLFRNSLRMIFSRRSIDCIVIGYLGANKEISAPRINNFSSSELSNSMGHEIKAHVGPFNKIKWLFQGEEIDLEAMVKFYLSEFIRISAK